jgi:ankyrin repeat protein
MEDEYGWTPLCKAAYNENEKFVGELLKKGESVNIGSRYGGNPLTSVAQ